ncbi:hypothetical protein D9M68_563150 [compost metagenome]
MRLAGCGQHRQLVTRLAEDRLDHPVHQQVGVATDRAGEVRVGLVGQAEVAAVDRRVDRLLHRAQQHGVDLLRVGALLGGFGDRLELAGTRLVGDAQADAHGLQVAAQDFLLLGRRAFVHAEQARVLAFGDEVGAADVGGEHRLLDQAVRLVARARHDLLDAAGVVADDLRLGGFEVDRAALAALLEQGLVDVGEVQQVLDAVLALGSLRAARVAEDGGDFGVREARVAEHHGGIELVGVDLAVCRNQHVAHHAQALDLGVERAQAVRQLLGQHRNHATREVDAGGAVVGIDVDGRAGLHIGAHVGDGHQQAPALAAAHLRGLAVHGVVEVAGVLAVDGDERHVGEVDAALLVGGAHLLGQGLGLRQALRGKLMRHAVLAHGDLDFHAGIVDITEHFHHAAHRLHIAVGILDQLDTDHLPHARLALRLGRDQDVLADALVLGRDHQHAALAEQPPDHEAVGALDDLDDLPFGPAAAVIAHHAHLRTVVVHGLLQFALGQEDIVFAIVADQETETVAVALHAASDKVGLVGQFIAALAVQFDLAVAFHRRQALLEAVMLLARDRQGLGDIACRLRRSRRSQHAQDFFPAGDRIVILIQFFLETI